MEVYLVRGTSTLRITCTGTFLEAYTVDEGEREEIGMTIPQTPVWGEFLSELVPFIDSDDELVIQLIGGNSSDEPLIGIEWVVDSDGITETAFSFGESQNWSSIPEDILH